MKTSDLNISEMMQSIQKKDKSYAQIYGILKISYWVLIAGMAIFLVIDIIRGTPTIEIIKSSSSLLGFALILITLWQKHKELRGVNYALPTLKMLKMFKNRYSIFSFQNLWMLFGFTLVVLSTSIGNTTRLWSSIFIIAIGLVVGLIIYYKNDKPLINAAKKMIEELEA